MSSARRASGVKRAQRELKGDAESPPVRRKEHSHAAMLEEWLLPAVADHGGGPTELAVVASEALGHVYTRQDVWHVLHQHNMTFKKTSPVPGLSVPSERAAFRQALERWWTRADQVRRLASGSALQ